MRVCAAVAEAVHRHRCCRVVGRERFGLGDHPQPVLGERDRRVQPVQCRLRRQLAMMQGERRLDHAGHAGRRFEVADGVLDRSDDQVGGAALDSAQGLAEGGHLHRVANRGTGAVCLDVSDLFRAQTGLGGHPADEVCLRLRVGDGDT